MTVTMNPGFLLINGVNFDWLDPADLKDGFTEAERQHKDFSKFFKRYFIEEVSGRKWGVQHMDQNFEIHTGRDFVGLFIEIDKKRYKIDWDATTP